MGLEKLSDAELNQYYEMYKKGMSGSGRFESRKIHNFDPKFAYHIVRLINEVEQILTMGDLDLQKNNEQLKDIRRGLWPEEELRKWFARREQELNAVYDASKLQYSPDVNQIKQLLIDCLEEHYGNLEKCVVNPDRASNLLMEIKSLLDKYNP